MARILEYLLNPELNCDSFNFVTKSETLIRSPREKLVQGLALAVLLLLGGLAFAGPSGVLAWSENLKLLEQRNAHIANLKADRDELKNRVGLLDPKHADPDLVGELLRRNLNVAHPDEVVIKLD
ncbi:hypothetical protein NT2_13_00320 [Caenibius tardaugens NBRC 16725]|uniref:Septum formation initiator n=1 Tax=Caenibius tardaugens NBRC 16725 TaxID=1219035 RepID=U2YPU0_9SPHN|nr:septum formation initiator family protein [Caenibius tardaugens]AZI37922.1 septum formation initiator [Caenibius tardaugens NBRC 16725]GAD50945.1 hypothetical protein NT2_13_00320 [Caenibius tardaugens NBRC 16725]